MTFNCWRQQQKSTWNYRSSWIGHHLNYQTSQIRLTKRMSAWGSSNLLHQNECASSTHQFSEVYVCQLTTVANEAFTSALNFHSECSADEPPHPERLTIYYRPNVMLLNITIVFVLYFKTEWTKQQSRSTFHFIKTQPCHNDTDTHNSFTMLYKLLRLCAVDNYSESASIRGYGSHSLSRQ
jgi:hypothetical protein